MCCYYTSTNKSVLWTNKNVVMLQLALGTAHCFQFGSFAIAQKNVLATINHVLFQTHRAGHTFTLLAAEATLFQQQKCSRVGSVLQIVTGSICLVLICCVDDQRQPR